jgi:hypothetical protein
MIGAWPCLAGEQSCWVVDTASREVLSCTYLLADMGVRGLCSKLSKGWDTDGFAQKHVAACAAWGGFPKRNLPSPGACFSREHGPPLSGGSRAGYHGLMFSQGSAVDTAKVARSVPCHGLFDTAGVLVLGIPFGRVSHGPQSLADAEPRILPVQIILHDPLPLLSCYGIAIPDANC